MKILLKSMLILLVVSEILFIAYTTATSECLIRDYGDNKKVCVCNSEHCDYYPINITPYKVNIFTSTQDGARYKKTVQKLERSSSSEIVIGIDREKQYQKIIGFGGAITDAAGITINSLPEEAKNHLMRSYFSEEGSLYNLCRIPMGGTDFSTHFYSFDDGPEDPDLQNFKLSDEDYKYKIPLMKMANQLTNTSVKFFSSHLHG